MAILEQIAISINTVTMTKNTKSAHGKPERWTGAAKHRFEKQLFPLF
jgi:hypothetical protein